MSVPKSIISDYLSKAGEITAFGVKLTEMTREELLAVTAYSCEAMAETAKAREKVSDFLLLYAKHRGVLSA